jgi:hypothetical protein
MLYRSHLAQQVLADAELVLKTVVLVFGVLALEKYYQYQKLLVMGLMTIVMV